MSNFICEKCGMTNIDCGNEGFKTPREIELEYKVKDLWEKYENLKIVAKKALSYYAEITLGKEYQKGKFKYTVKKNKFTGEHIYIEYDASIAQQALQKMEEVK